MTFLYCLNLFSLRVLKTFRNYIFTMNEPRVPLNNKDWNDIDIFLFSNGQQYSPPRKYHLRADELEFWESTMLFMAQTQYGPMYSNMELYTLDGKKIDSPLELVDANSYVAVKPPDVFIPGGYEQYLIKASRSWEKRQEKLNNMADVTDEINATKDQEYTKSATDEFKANETTNIQNPKNIMEKDFDSNSTNNTIISRLRKETDKSSEEKQREYKPFVYRKSADTAKSKIIKVSQHNGKDDSILNKKKNISVPKNLKNGSSRKSSILTKNDRNNPKPNNPKEKIQPNLTKSPDEIEVKERIVLSKPNDLNENQSREDSNISSDKCLLTSSDVYKNPDSEVQSTYIDAERKTMQREDLYKNKYKCPELHKIDELNDELENSQKDHKAISVQSITCCNNKNRPDNCTSFASRAKVFNINLNIEVRDERDFTDSERNGRLGKCKSYIELFTAEQESQTNNNMDLNDEDLKFENSTPRRKSLFSDKAYFNSDVGGTKVVVVKCTCEVEAENINNKSKDNYIALVPSTVADKNDESSTCRPFNTELADRDILKTRHSILNTVPQNLRNNLISTESSQVTIKHKVSICPDSPIKISDDLPFSIKKYSLNVNSNQKVDKFTQTEWCNILLQAQPQANEHFSFHFPPLHVLAQYNLL